MSTAVSYGSHVADDSELRLCGELSGRRALVLGVGPDGATNAVAIAERGAKAIVLDPSADVIATVRTAAERAEVRVECHVGELADLGFATSASIDLVLAAHTLDSVDDLPRLLRQVHRVLRPDALFVLALRHPVAAMFDDVASAGSAVTAGYGVAARPFSEWFMAFQRTDFRPEVLHELVPRDRAEAAAPTVLVVRARKLGV